MHDYKLYDRSFIVLLPETGGYSASGQKLTGTVILEIRNGKGRATVTIQGLKPSAAGVYKIYLISSGDSEAVGVPLGAFAPNEKGRCSGTWDFDPVSVGGSGIEYIDFNVVAVIVKGSAEIIAPLVGYKNGAVMWKSRFREYTPLSVSNTVERKSEQKMDVPETEESLLETMGDNEICKTEDTNIKSEADEAFRELSKRLENAVNFNKTEELHRELSAVIADEEYARFLNLVTAIIDYIPADEREYLALLLEEAAGIIHCIPQEGSDPMTEMLTSISEYIPGKVKESITVVFNEIAGSISACEYNHFHSIVKRCAEFYASEKDDSPVEEELKYYSMDSLEQDSCKESVQPSREDTHVVAEGTPLTGGAEPPEAAETRENTEGKSERDEEEQPPNDKKTSIEEATTLQEYPQKDRIQLKSGVEGEYTLKEPIAGENHGAIFIERLREFNENFDKIEGTRKESEVSETSGGAKQESASFAKDSRHEKTKKRSFSEEELYKFFEKSKRAEPFHAPNTGRKPPGKYPPVIQPGFPPAVPPAIPIYDIRWAQITQNDIYLMPEKLWIYASNPFVSHAYRKYGHLLLGVSGHHGGRSYYLGVPGVYSERDRMRALALGFTSFMPVNGGVPRRGEFGYWILKAI